MGSEWKVVEVPSLPVLGECARDELTIRLRKGLPPTVRETTFFHELTHALLFSTGKTEHDEVFVDLFGALLHQYVKTQK